MNAPGSSSTGHIPVLRDEAVAWLAPRDGGVYLDGTFGGGGYARMILQAARCTLWALDRDPAAIARGAALAAEFPGRLSLLAGRFSEVLELLNAQNVNALDGAVFDLGVSSYQLDDPARGFSFRADGPLDMRMGGGKITAATLINTMSESELADTLYQFGEEKASRRIAKAIVERRRAREFTTTADLAEVIRSVVRPDKSGMDPATRSFQALRIAVNDELSDIEAALQQAAGLLAPGGRLVVVSFHSLEDRLVKRFFLNEAGRAAGASRHDPAGLAPPVAPRFKLLTTAPRTASPEETRRNPTRQKCQTPRHRTARRVIRPFTLLTVILAASAGAYLFAVKHRAQVLDDQLASVAQQSRLDGQRIRVLQAQWALEIDPTRLTHLASQFTTLQPVKPAQLVTLAALRQVLPPPGGAAPEPNPEEPMPVQLETPAADVPDTSAFSTTVAANGLPLPPPQTPPDLGPANLTPPKSTSPVVTELAAADPAPRFATTAPLAPPPSLRPTPHRVRVSPTRVAQNVTPPAFGAARNYDMSSSPPLQPIGAQLVSVRASASTGTALATSNAAATGAVATGGSMLGMAQDGLAPPQPLGTDN